MGSDGKHNLTPEYVAPEILLGNSYDEQTADWWMLGILIYEMLVGIPPFYHLQESIMLENILSGPLEYPEKLSGEACDIINKVRKAQYFFLCF